MRGEVGCCLGCAVKLILELGNDSDEVAAFYGDAARLAEVLGA